jgi:hypothetical protein
MIYHIPSTSKFPNRIGDIGDVMSRTYEDVNTVIIISIPPYARRLSASVAWWLEAAL